MAALFLPFNRLEAEFSDIEGTGIGLTIVRNLVEMMGGSVGADSELGVGSTFWIELPADVSDASQAPAASTESAGEQPAHPAPVQRHRVLCIDDNPVNIKLMVQLLGLRQHIDLVTAHAPELGIELALAHRPDLILLDINMPGMDGYQVLKVLQADARVKSTPVIAITANAMPRDIERGLAAGFADYITKPIHVKHFIHIVDHLLADTAKANHAPAQ